MLVINKGRLLVFIAIVGAVFLTGLGILYSSMEVYRNERNITVIIDPGHGAPDGGAVGVGGTLEKDINLKICKKIEEVLYGKGINTLMTRTGDEGLFESRDGSLREKKREDMNTRLSIMKKSGADLFLSIHMNSINNNSANGLHIFYSENHPEIKALAESIQERISQITGAAAHTVKAADKRLFLMKQPPIPAVLAECGFISNPEEEKKLNDDDYQSRIAWAVAEAVEEYFKG